MSTRKEETLPASRPRSRKSIAHMPNSAMDKENMTADLGVLQKREPLAVKKKSRSKSIGPGGLDALTDSTGNRRQSIITPAPKSILKPTIPPLKEIPARKPSPKKGQSSAPVSEKNETPEDPSQSNRASVTGAEVLPNPFMLDTNAAVAETRVALRTEEEQQKATKEREEKERLAMEKDVNARREARRKSLANRRVSFAPEATLHTWDVVEYMQDSTTSSSSTNSTRRASSTSSAAPASPYPSASMPGSDASEPPSTPPEQVEEETTASPAHQRDLHQKKRRRSSGIPPLNFNNPEDEFLSSSPYSGDSSIGEEDIVEDDGSDSNSDSDDGTAMILEEGDTTSMSMASEKSAASSTGSSARLEEALRLASRQAGTQGIEFDEHGGMEEEDEEEAIVSFTPWSKPDSQNRSAMQDQENINPFSPAFKESIPAGGDYEDGEDEMDMDMEMTQAVGRIIPDQQSEDDMTMDMTVAVGGILPQQHASSNTRRKSMATRRQSTRRQSMAADSSFGDEPMDLTMAIGGIQPSSNNRGASNEPADDEEMTMEFTSVIGGVLAPGKRASVGRRQSRRISSASTNDDAPMDMTVAVGSILPAHQEPTTSGEDDDTFAMDITVAVGKILPSVVQSEMRSQAKRLMEVEVDSSEPVSSPFQAEIASAVPKVVQSNTVASETGSPSLAAFKGKGLRRSNGPSRQSTTPRSNKQPSMASTPVKEPSTPAKQITPKPARPTTPGKTPPSKNVVMRSASPKRIFQEELDQASATPLSGSTKTVLTIETAGTPNKLFQKDNKTGLSTPSVVLNPKRRRSSGVGIDKEGLGSPRLAAILDRRVSIGETAGSFSPGQFLLPAAGVRFGEAEVMSQEIDQEREAEEERENGRKIMEREADIEEEKGVTLNLKNMIESLTPKKNPLKGRKSLHVGAAKGILGKRPAELDDDSDDDESGVKRLKNHQGSPVKNIKLQAPPTKEETTGHLTRSARKSLAATSGNVVTPTITSSPVKAGVVTTPRGQSRFKDVEQLASAQKPVPFLEKSPLKEPEVVEEFQDEEPMQLQDFLNMTSIRFMELTTTKRRHTVAPKSRASSGAVDSKADLSLESCVVACACTIPMLELFQHSCRELKKYISEGRNIVREIEADTFEENPPLFREYISATPDVRMLMDNQFKNVKTHARLVSKGMWYEWRMQLLTGLTEGLNKMVEGMHDDSEIVQHQLDLLDSVLPPLIERHEKLAQEEAELQAAAAELADCDQEELEESRQTLIALDEDVEAKKRLIADLQAQIKETDDEIQKANNRKEVCLGDIREAEKIREECRGWTGNEVLALKAKVDALEQEYGWTVTGVSKGSTASMSYRNDLELVFNVSSFHGTGASTKQQNSQIDLWYIGASRDSAASPETMEKKFFVENIRDHCRGLTQSQTTIRDLLNTVSGAWTRALSFNDQILALQLELPTEITKTSDTSILVSSTLLLADIGTKVKLQFHLIASSTEKGFEVDVQPRAQVVYGNAFNEQKMTEFVAKRIEEMGNDAKRSWISAVLDLEERLMARGRK